MTDNSLGIQFHLPQIQALIIIMLVPDVANYINEIRVVALLGIQSATDVTRKGIKSSMQIKKASQRSPGN